MERTYTVSVYNTFTGKYESVEVSEEIYRIYGNGKTANHDDDRRFFSHEIQFSGLIGGNEDAYEHFREFRTTDCDPQEILCESCMKESLAKALASLSADQKEDIMLAFYEGIPVGEVARTLGISRQAEYKRRLVAYAKLKNFLEEQGI